MDTVHKKILKGIVLEIRHILEGRYHAGNTWHPGDLEQRLAAIGVRRNREPVPIDELSHLSDIDKLAREVVDAYLVLRKEAGIELSVAVAEFVRETAYTWANRLLALRCMEARGLIDDVILQKKVYGGRSLEHHRLAQRQPELCSGEDDGMYAVLDKVFEKQDVTLPLLFDPKAPGVALKPTAAAVKRCVGLLSGNKKVNGQGSISDDVFKAPDALGWAYQYWNTEEKDLVFERVRTKKGAKIEGADIIPATQLYTEPYMVKFLVQNSLGATWVGMRPHTRLVGEWEYFVRDADRTPVENKPVRGITFLDPACGSGHFLIEAFDLFYAMYKEEGHLTEPEDICRSILENNLFGIDIDERAVQIAEAALWMKAAEKAFDFAGAAANLVATNIRLPKGKDHLTEFLKKHPEDKPLRPALEVIFKGLKHADQLGSLLQIEEPVEKELKHLKEKHDTATTYDCVQGKLFEPTTIQGKLPLGIENYDDWKKKTVASLKKHFGVEAESADLGQAFFGQTVGKGLALFDLLARRYDVVAANPPYMGFRKFGVSYLEKLKGIYPNTYQDLYVAFIERAIFLLCKRGKIAIISLNTWLSLETFVPARAQIFSRTTIIVMAVLGTGTFRDLSNTNAMGFCMFVLGMGEDVLKDSVFLDCTYANEKKPELLRCIENSSVIRKNLKDFKAIPGTPIAYTAPDSVIRAFSTFHTVKSVCKARQGLKTGDNNRFMRFVWECPASNWRVRWHPCTRGGEYRRWRGNFYAAGDWEVDGLRLRNFASANGRLRSRPQNTDMYFQEGITWTTQTSYGFSARKVDKGFLIESAGPLAATHEAKDLNLLLGLLNCRLTDFLFNLVQPNIGFGEGYIEKIPIPSIEIGIRQIIGLLSNACIEIVKVQENQEIDSVFATFTKIRGDSLSVLVKTAIGESLFRHALRHTIEATIENIIYKLYGFEQDEDIIYQRVGIPAGWFPILDGYTNLPDFLVKFPEQHREVFEHVKHLEIKQISDQQEIELKRTLRLLYELGPNAGKDFQDLKNEYDVTSDKRSVPIPTETCIEEFSRKLLVNPISVYWLLKEGIEKEGWRCPREDARITADRFTVTILHILGHRWPKQIEANEPIPPWADGDGIIPLTDGTNEQTLLNRVRRRIAAKFEGGDVAAIEHEFAEIMGKPLDKWLEIDFFKHHIKQFKKRPIAWQVQSGKYTRKTKPAFVCLGYYQQLDRDTLPKIRTQYVGSLRLRFETELRGIETILTNARSARQEKRRIELLELIAELKEMDGVLTEINRQGFGPKALYPALRQAAIDDAMLCLKAMWLSRLSGVVQKGPLPEWIKQADAANLDCDLSLWIDDAFVHLDYFCNMVGPKPPRGNTLRNDPDAGFFSNLICPEAGSMVKNAMDLACKKWWKPFDTTILKPLREEMKHVKDRIKQFKSELKELGKGDIERIFSLEGRIDDLKADAKRLKTELDDKVDRVVPIREAMESWNCPEAETWEPWLAQQPMFDAISGLDGRRNPPDTIANFIRQESLYAPDVNDGVRVNIAPIQKAGLLAANVLASKDVDKAIAARIEWRAGERRWCREGKLPKPGWWPETDLD